MPKASKLQAATIGGTADEIEASFYEALRTGDIERLMACWADEDDVVCVHPGGPRLLGPESIRNSFDAMFANGVIAAYREHVRKIESITSAMHNLVERIELHTPEGDALAYVVATNIYMRTPQGWRMVAHHASPGTQQEMLVHIESMPSVLH